MKYSDVKLSENYKQEIEEWSVEKHTEQTSTDAYGVINFQGGSHSYRAKACMTFSFFITLNMLIEMVDASFNFWNGRLKTMSPILWQTSALYYSRGFLNCDLNYF